jgi:vanillate O-demethylase ferredoxin subunit
MTTSIQQRAPTRLFVRVARVFEEALGIRSYELVSLDEKPLPPFTAGAHIGVAVPLVGNRHYSLTNCSSETSRYVIGIQSEPLGRGGSQALHRRMRVGSIVKITPPQSDFALMREGKHILIGGGIGLTPMLSMLKEARLRDQEAHLFICTRSQERTPFKGELLELASAGLATVHHSEASGLIDLQNVLGAPSPSKHVYCCGPAPLIKAVSVAATSAGWPASQIHFESFTPPPGTVSDTPFSVNVRSTGETLDVAPNESLLSALRREGLPVESSCEIGSCGACRVRYSGGRAIHRDSFLRDEERNHYLLTCVSRAEGNCVTLDI